MRVILRHHAAWPECSHMQPDGRGTWPAIVKEGDRPVGGRNAFLEISDVEHRSFRLRVLVVTIVRRGLLLAPRGIAPALGMNDDSPGHGAIIHPPPFDIYRTVADRACRLE